MTINKIKWQGGQMRVRRRGHILLTKHMMLNFLQKVNESFYGGLRRDNDDIPNIHLMVKRYH